MLKRRKHRQTLINNFSFLSRFSSTFLAPLELANEILFKEEKSRVDFGAPTQRSKLLLKIKESSSFSHSLS
jgi:hypothetical protein